MGVTEIIVLIAAIGIVAGAAVSSVIKRHKAKKSGNYSCGGCCECCRGCAKVENPPKSHKNEQN